MTNLSESTKQAIVGNIVRNMASRASSPMSFKQGDEAAYLNANDRLVQSTVGAVGGETLYLNNGDWCYVWGAVNLSIARGL